jgi:hypothetical protein
MYRRGLGGRGGGGSGEGDDILHARPQKKGRRIIIFHVYIIMHG